MKCLLSGYGYGSKQGEEAKQYRTLRMKFREGDALNVAIVPEGVSTADGPPHHTSLNLSGRTVKVGDSLDNPVTLLFYDATRDECMQMARQWLELAHTMHGSAATAAAPGEAPITDRLASRSSLEMLDSLIEEQRRALQRFVDDEALEFYADRYRRALVHLEEAKELLVMRRNTAPTDPHTTNGRDIPMTYKVIGTGPQFPTGHEQDASTAGEALNKRRAAEGLCGQAIVRDAFGREVSISELERVARAEREAAR